MLYYKHLKPWLLIYLIAGVLLFLTTSGIIIIIILNEINGFNFTQVQFSTCPAYTNKKLGLHMKTMLQVCFAMSCLAVLFSLGQCIIVVWQFVVFRKFASENNQNQNQTFETLSLKKLAVLYILNVLGFLTLVPTVGSFATFFIQLKNCLGSQNHSEKYTIPGIIALSALIFQIWSFCMILKLCYHFYQDEKEDESSEEGEKMKQKEKSFESPQVYKKRQKEELEEIKKRILQSKTEMDESKNQNGKNLYDSHSTHGSPNNTKDRLLNKNFNGNAEDNIYGMSNGFDQDPLLRGRKKKNIENLSITNYSNQNRNLENINDTNDNYGISNLNYPSGRYPNNKDLLLDPNEISQQQRRIMKKLHKNSYKKKRRRNRPNDVIFEDPNQDWENAVNNYGSNRKNRPTERYISEEEEKKAQIQIKKLQKLIDKPPTMSSKNAYFYIFKTRYNHLMHLVKQKKGVVSPSQRRCIKRPLLGFKSNIVQFDAKKYDVEEFVIQQEKIEENEKDKSKEPHSQVLVGSEPNLQNGVQLGNPVQKQPEVSGQVSLHISPQKVCRIKASRSAADIWQQGFTEGRKTQYYNPINGYVEQGDDYEQKIRRILEFDQICSRQKTQKYDPFEIHPQKTSQSKEKLYLHKNKPKISRIQIDNDDMEQYCHRTDPFREMAFEDDWFMNRGLLMREDSNQNAAKSEKKGLIDGLLSTGQPKRVHRKEAELIELIRGKNPIQFL